MKPARLQTQALGKACTNSVPVTSTGCTRSIISTRKTRGKQQKGKQVATSSDIDDQQMCSPTVQSLSGKFQSKGTVLPVNTTDMSKLKLEIGQKGQSRAKLKLQLFPIDEVTLSGLEKDGHNPYLELILSEKKKISSVLKHLNSKWGSSSIALGELMLFPYNSGLDSVAGCKRWTSKDMDTRAIDVYIAIERPPIFRLRYGWFSHLEPKTDYLPHTSFSKDCRLDNLTAATEDVKKESHEVDNKEDGTVSTDVTKNAVVGEIDPLDRSVEPQDSRIGDGIMLSSSLWADSLTNISLGGLLSEASLHAAVSQGDVKPTGIDSRTPFSCDSFDAAIAAHISGHRQAQQQRPVSHSSILDAEETCHAFQFGKSPSSELVAASTKLARPGSCIQNVKSNSFKFPFALEEKAGVGLPISHDVEEHKASWAPETQKLDDVESSLGITNFNWSDSSRSLSGLALPPQQHFISLESLTFSNLFPVSKDAFQSSSLNTGAPR